MSRISILGVLILVTNGTLWAQFEHPDLKSRKTVIKNVVILPPNIRIVKSGVKADEELVEESRKTENSLVPLIANVIQKRGCTADEKQFSSERLQSDPEAKYAVADLQRK